MSWALWIIDILFAENFKVKIYTNIFRLKHLFSQRFRKNCAYM